MKQFRKHRLALLLIPVLLICASAFGLGAYTVSKEPSPLKKAALFAEAERDLEALADLSGAKHITVRDGQDVDIGEAGIWIIDGAASAVTVSVTISPTTAASLSATATTLTKSAGINSTFTPLLGCTPVLSVTTQR